MLGFPGTALSRLSHLGDAPVRAGVRLILVDRPGQGGSDAHPGRTLLDWPRDVAAFADAFGLERFAVLGCSGGGPHALACGHALAGRVERVILVSSVGPAWDDVQVAAGMRPERRRLVEAARGDLAAAEADIRRECEQAIAADPDEYLDDPDPEVRTVLAAGIRETAARGPDGIAQDLILNYLRPWGFGLEGVVVPATVWHGDDDTDVPVEVGLAVARRLPERRLHVIPGEGHSLLWTRRDEILADIQAQAG